MCYAVVQSDESNFVLVEYIDTSLDQLVDRGPASILQDFVGAKECSYPSDMIQEKPIVQEPSFELFDTSVGYCQNSTTGSESTSDGDLFELESVQYANDTLYDLQDCELSNYGPDTISFTFDSTAVQDDAQVEQELVSSDSVSCTSEPDTLVDQEVAKSADCNDKLVKAENNVLTQEPNVILKLDSIENEKQDDGQSVMVPLMQLQPLQSKLIINELADQKVIQLIPVTKVPPHTIVKTLVPVIMVDHRPVTLQNTPVKEVEAMQPPILASDKASPPKLSKKSSIKKLNESFKKLFKKSSRKATSK
jgi:hypothetical protein